MMHDKFEILHVKLCIFYKLKFTKKLFIQVFVLYTEGFKMTVIFKNSVILTANKTIIVKCIN